MVAFALMAFLLFIVGAVVVGLFRNLVEDFFGTIFSLLIVASFGLGIWLMIAEGFWTGLLIGGGCLFTLWAFEEILRYAVRHRSE